ncbi:PD-(D/E)XK nuclease domain-containing protein [Tenacibaculum singaporense]|uniref:PD-(D/E)XK nuclease domain-containing protein n=1 Tax=Tenacibaculum singaporense TaxID=2358479 RepID=UPI000F66FCE7|nr:hypothetical protein [Tenacibaculum singaporense]RSC93708.1 hypothetical protein EI424_06795 [Tenacibaculum singaporense]
MVYLREIIKKNKTQISQYNNIETVAYLYVSSSTQSTQLENINFELSPEETVALDGYLNKPDTYEKIISIISKPSIKGIDATSNIFKFSGLYLGAKDLLEDKLTERFLKGNLKEQFFLSKVEPSLKDLLIQSLNLDLKDPFSVLANKLLEVNDVSETDINNALTSIISKDLDIYTLLLLEEFENQLLQVKFISKTPEEVLRGIFHNFPNAVQKIISNRRKGHPEFEIKDEYDVQDLLYVILKSIFPNMRDEDPIPKVGSKSTKIDLILREEKILIEVKMIKEKDSNETHFIEQLKVDFESYHKCVWLDKLFCFVYDPFKKTRDVAYFNDLNGKRTKGEHNYDVEVIVVN